MSTETIKVTEETLKKIHYFYKDHLLENKNPHALFIAKNNNTTITAYNSQKVVFQGENASYEASIFSHGQEKIASKQKKATTSQQTEDDHFYRKVSIGSDEVGTGDYFGPVVVVSAYVDDAALSKISKLKIDDSKKITDKDILEIAPTLFKVLPYSLMVVKNEKYNQIMEEPSMNLNKVKAMLHKQAIQTLVKKIAPTQPTIIIDKFCSIDNFNRYTNDRSFLTGNVIFTTKAESKYLSVACASIMARYIFLQEMDKLSEMVKTTLLKGASDKVDKQARTLVQTFGMSILTKIAKLHFKNTEKVSKTLD